MTEINIVRCKNELGVFNLLSSEEYIGRYLREGKIWEQAIVNIYSSVLNPGDEAINVGAHVGLHAIPMSRKCHRVHAFEPQFIMHWLLKINIVDNEVDNIVPYNKAVGHRSDITVSITDTVQDLTSKGKGVSYNSNYPINFGGLCLGPGSHKVSMIKLDELSLNPKLMLVDVEGAESLVFYGAQETIKRSRPIIIYECSYKQVTEEMKTFTQASDQEATFSITSFTKGLRYQPQIIMGGDSVLFPYPSEYKLINDSYTNGARIEGHLIRLPGRKDAILIYLGDNWVLGFFLDVTEIVKGFISDNNIHWSNNSIWSSDKISAV